MRRWRAPSSAASCSRHRPLCSSCPTSSSCCANATTVNPRRVSLRRSCDDRRRSPRAGASGAEPAQRPPGEHDRSSAFGHRLLGLGAILLLFGALAFGVWRHYARHLEVTAIAKQHHDFVPNVRVAAVRASAGTMSVTLPATTNAFKAADIFARASGYITERNVDIGSHVKAGDLLAVITAPSSTTRSPRPRP